MSFIKNLKVMFKLLLLVAPLIIMTVFFLFQFSYKINKINKDAEKNYYDILYYNSALIINADRDFYQSAIAEQEYVLSGDKLDAAEKESLLQGYIDNYGQVLSRTGEANQNLIQEKKLYNDFIQSESQTTFSQMYESFTDNFNKWLAAYDPATGKGDYTLKESYFASARNELDQMTILLDEYSKEITAETDKSVKNDIFALIVTICAVTLLISLLAVYIIRYLRNNIVKLTKEMNALAENDLTFEPYSTRSKDELGTLASSISTLIYSLRSVVSRLVESSDKLTESSGSMRINSDEVTSSMNEIAKTVGEIAEGASNQAEDAQQLVREITNLGDSISKSTESAKILSDSSQNIMAASREGLNSVNQLENITLQNQSAFQSIFNIIDTTSVNAGKIGEASAMISNIAKKTKLLALNASIEAASAGEAGKGFAVVAEEIRKLSELSKNSTMVIDQMINELTNNIYTASVQSGIVKDAVKLQTVSVGDTKNKYLAIVRDLDKINKEIASLDAVSKTMEQSRIVVSDIGSNVSAISEEYAASTEETSATTQEVLAAMTNIEQIGIEVDNLVIELKGIISKFKLIK